VSVQTNVLAIIKLIDQMIIYGISDYSRVWKILVGYFLGNSIERFVEAVVCTNQPFIFQLQYQYYSPVCVMLQAL